MVSLLAALGSMSICVAGEWLHARRVRRVAQLAFGPAARPRRWVVCAIPLRVAAVGAVVWGLVTLLHLDAAPPEKAGEPVTDRLVRHVVIALDVSPSMQLEDAGPRGDESRADRARKAVRSLLARLDAQRTRVSIIAFYSTARPVIVDTFDPEVVANVLDDLPLEHAFVAGKTDLYSGVKAARDLAKGWREGSAAFVTVSDGDTLPPRDLPELSAAFARVLVLGVGNPDRGVFIDGHSSRQDVQSLERLALRLGGRYLDVNSRHVPSDVVISLIPSFAAETGGDVALRQAALFSVAAGSFMLAGIPLLLAWGGTGFRAPQVGIRGVSAHAAGLHPASLSAAAMRSSDRLSPVES